MNSGLNFVGCRTMTTFSLRARDTLWVQIEQKSHEILTGWQLRELNVLIKHLAQSD